MDLSGGLKEQELDRGVEVLTRDQTGLGPDQSHIRGRPVGLQAGNPFGHHQLVQEGAQGHSGIRAANGEQVELLGSQQSLDERGFPRGHHGRRVDPAPEKLLGCVLWRESEQLDRALGELVHGEHVLHQSAGPAAFGFVRDTPALEAPWSLARVWASIEDPEGFVKDGP